MGRGLLQPPPLTCRVKDFGCGLQSVCLFEDFVCAPLSPCLPSVSLLEDYFHASTLCVCFKTLVVCLTLFV